MPDANGRESIGPAATRYALGLLMVIYTVNHIDRQIMHILIEPVRLDLNLSDTQIGALVGAGFAIFYTVAGLPIARLADRGIRRNIIAVALAIWSVMTVASGLARGFMTLMAARIGVGVGEAGCTPPAHSLISDYFPPERRATALSIYALGVPIGTLFGLAFGGYLADQVGWRSAFFVVGAPGVLLAVITRMTLREPPRGQSDAGANLEVEPLRDVLSFMWKLRSLRHTMIGTSLQTLTLAGWGAWNAPFLVRVYDMSLTQVGLSLGLIAGIAGAAGTFGGGWLADRFSSRDQRWYLWWPALGAVLSIPFSVVAYLTESRWLALAL
ncbi:MFS transporter, partial [Myxococcota bacterium]|nr:MFS transporter [Myxococcota bacterium]